MVGTYIAEGHLMLTEGVPAAMIENVARMAGMPVGPLSLNDEIAVDLSLKIMDATRKDLGAEAVPEAQYRLIDEMVNRTAGSAGRTARASTTTPTARPARRSCGRASSNCSSRTPIRTRSMSRR